MESLSKGTKHLWEDNFDAFVKWGENHKAQLGLTIESQKLESFISNLDYNYKWISNFSADSDNVYDPISKIFDAWSNDKMILLNKENEQVGNVVIGVSSAIIGSKFPFKFMICSEEEASNIAPTIKCPSFKHKFNYVLHNIPLYIQLNEILSTNWVLLNKRDGVIRYEEIKNSVYIFYQNKKQKINKCQIKTWYWKPKIVRSYNEMSLEDFYSAIEDGRVSSDVNKFRFDSILILKEQFLGRNENEINRLQTILNFLEINQQSTVKIKLLIAFFQDVHYSPNELKINSKEFVFAFKGKVYKAKWNKYGAKFQEITLIQSCKSNIVVIKWKAFISSNLSITYANDSTYLKSDWYEQFLKEEDSPDKLNMYVIISKSNIIEIVHSHLEIINEMWDLSILQKVGIKATSQEYDQKYFISILEKLPRTSSIELFFDDEESWFLTNKSVWIALFKLKQVEFMYNNNYNIKINFEDQELNQTDILETKIKASINDQDKEITILEIRDYFRIKHFESNIIFD